MRTLINQNFLLNIITTENNLWTQAKKNNAEYVLCWYTKSSICLYVYLCAPEKLLMEEKIHGS